MSDKEYIDYSLAPTGEEEHKQAMLDYLEELKTRINDGEIAGFAVFGVHGNGDFFGGTAFKGGISMTDIRNSARELFYHIDQAKSQEAQLRAAASSEH